MKFAKYVDAAVAIINNNNVASINEVFEFDKKILEIKTPRPVDMKTTINIWDLIPII